MSTPGASPRACDRPEGSWTPCCTQALEPAPQPVVAAARSHPPPAGPDACSAPHCPCPRAAEVQMWKLTGLAPGGSSSGARARDPTASAILSSTACPGRGRDAGRGLRVLRAETLPQHDAHAQGHHGQLSVQRAHCPPPGSSSHPWPRCGPDPTPSAGALGPEPEPWVKRGVLEAERGGPATSGRE